MYPLFARGFADVASCQLWLPRPIPCREDGVLYPTLGRQRIDLAIRLHPSKLAIPVLDLVADPMTDSQ